MAAGGEHGTKAVVAALTGNLGIAAAKIVGFLITRSASLLAEAVHSIADSGNQALLLVGNKQARQEATESHQFGYARARYFWSFVVALVLFELGAVFAIYEGIHKIEHPAQVENLPVALVILGIAIGLESWSFRTGIGESRPLKGDMSWWRFIRASRTPELPVVLLEDFGALFGLAIAFSALALSELTGDPVWDGIGTVAIGVLLGVIATVLVVEMKSLLLGEGASPEDMAKIRTAIQTTPGVTKLIHLRTQHLGPEELLVAAKLAFDTSMSAEQIAAVINTVEVNVREQVPYAKPMYVEVGVFGPDPDPVTGP
ncbi:MAG: cation diffusion facilitator family transporter [Acidimicrobiia bacterium]|nr:cation diffusion facilitator family transporter [Acidimicrobiia bacterium]MDH4364652.1 cation diffusion facilitator family transporter [Acidimicrobiia bacterium]